MQSLLKISKYEPNRFKQRTVMHWTRFTMTLLLDSEIRSKSHTAHHIPIYIDPHDLGPFCSWFVNFGMTLTLDLESWFYLNANQEPDIVLYLDFSSIFPGKPQESKNVPFIVVICAVGFLFKQRNIHQDTAEHHQHRDRVGLPGNSHIIHLYKAKSIL